MIVSEKYQYKAHGKLLLSGEYFVLDGAVALALPTKKGQHFTVEPFHAEPNILLWESYDSNGKLWFEGWFSLPNAEWIEGNNSDVGHQLERLFKAAQSIRKINFPTQSIAVKSTLEFPRDWGLGSSSTMISFLGQWLGVNPFELLRRGFGGSGYDVACAQSNTPITYQISRKKPIVTPINFHPTFHENLFFIHQGMKQSSRSAIHHYRETTMIQSDTIQLVTELSERFIKAKTLAEFQSTMLAHEQFISQHLSLPMIQDSFPDFPGQTKSLGAWGGDFILAASDKNRVEVTNYFQKIGLNVVIPYAEMVY